MGRRLRVGDEALGVAEIVRDADDRERVGDPERSRLAAGNLEREHRAASLHLPPCERRLRVIGAARIEGAHDRRMSAEEFGDLPRGAGLRRNPYGQRLQRLQERPGVERRETRAGLAEEIVNVVGDEFFARQDDPAEHAPLTVDVLGRRIDDAIGAELHRMLQQRRREHVVDHERRASPMHDLGDGGDIDDFERRVGRRFEERRFGVRAHRRPPRVEVRAVDEGRGDAEARQELLDHVEARAEQGPRGDDVVARLELAHERGGDRGHSARRRPRRLGALEQRHSLLEHRHRRIGEARVDEPRIVALEARLGQLHRVVEIALGEKKRLGCLFESRPQRSAVDQLRRRPERLGIAGFARARHRSSPLRRRRLTGLETRRRSESAPIF